VSNRTAPVVIFAYRRPIHTQRVVDALLANPEAQDTDLIVFVDGPKTPREKHSVNEVLAIFSSLTGFASIDVQSSPTNLGLARSVIQGVTSVLGQHDRIIVLEDDILVSPNFLEYMNSALDLYENEEAVASIHGYVYPIERELPPTFFIRGADCWGWATWRRAWEKFNPDGRGLLQQLKDSGQTRDFDFDDSGHYTAMLRGQIAGTNDSWAVRWYASAFLENMLTLYTGKSLVRNIGFDGSGTHSGTSRELDTDMAKTKIRLAAPPINIKESSDGREAFEMFFRSLNDTSHKSLVHLSVRRLASLIWRRVPSKWQIAARR
jgi:hypothetical protein